MGKTKYSRQTRSKSTLSATMSTPRLGNNGCPLCSDRSIPENLNGHVSDDQTCADVHLQLAMLRYDNAMCAVGQEKYEELCCTAKSSSGFKSSFGLMIGVVVAGVFLKKIFSSRRRRIRQEKEIYDDEELPGTVSFSSRSSRNSSRSGTTDLEMPSTSYVNMDQSNPNSNRGKKGRYPSRSRDRTHGEHDNNYRLDRTRSSSCPGGGKNDSRVRDSSRSRNQRKEIPETNRSNRDRPLSRRQARSRSRPRDMQDMPETTRSNRDRPMSRSRAQSRSRPRDMLDQAHTSRDRSFSRSRVRSRSRPREKVENHSINRSRTARPRSRSRSRARGKPESQEGDLYRSNGYNGSRLPTQVL